MNIIGASGGAGVATILLLASSAAAHPRGAAPAPPAGIEHTPASLTAARADTFDLAREYPPGSGALRLEISRSERELYIFVGGELVRTLPVAVGQPDHPTPVGEWAIHQVDWNPDWTPPDSEWAEDSDYMAPGEEGNPMGRARLIFRAPYSIHGTDALDSLGRRASHGSVRVSNDQVLGLARLVQEHGGADRSEEWYRTAVGTPTEMYEVSLPDPVPIAIRD